MSKFSRVTNTFDDITIKNLNYINSPILSEKENKNENDIIQSTSKNNFLYKNENSKNLFSLKNKTNEIFNLKSDNNKQIEERKNIDIEKPNINNYDFNLNNKLNYKKNNENNIKDILSQNRRILSDITNIINNDNKRELNYGNEYYKSSYSTIQNNLTNNENKSEGISNNITSITNITNNENENEKNKKGETYFNYNEDYKKKMGGEDNYLENIEKYNNERNGKINNEKLINNNKFDTNINNEKYISSSIYNFEKQDIGVDKINDILKNKNEINKKVEENGPGFNPTFNNYNNLLNKKEYNFNYRNDDSFNKINKTDTQSLPSNYKTEPKINNFLDNKIIKNEISTKYNMSNEYYLKPDNDNNLKFNNYINSNNSKIKNNNLLYNNLYNNTPEKNNLEEKERQIKLQLENEEKKLKQLEEEKNQLIKEEKERQKAIFNELSKRENSFKENKTELTDILEKNKKNDYQIKPINIKNLDFPKKYENLNTSQNENYYKDYLNEISNRNDLINKKALEVINNNINNTDRDNINNLKNKLDLKVNTYEKININIPKKKSLSVNNKQIEIKDYIHNYYPNSNNNTNSLYDKTIKTINSNNTSNLYKPNKIRYDSEKKYNVNSYFQLKDNINNTDVNINYNKPYYNTNAQSFSSYIDEKNIENNEYINKNNINSNNNLNNKNYQASLTPNGLYRNNKADINIFSTSNLGANPTDNLLYNKNYYNSNCNRNRNNSEIVKTLSANNFNTMTQTRYYRNRVFPDNDYGSDTLKNLNKFELINNNVNTNNFKKQNSSRTLSHLNFDLDKDYLNNSNKYNYISNSSNLINNNTYNTLSSPNTTRNSNIYKSNKYTKSNSYRCKCILRKGRSYNDITKLIEPNNKSINSDMNSFLKNLRNNKGYDLSSNLIKKNNYNNLVYKTFNQNNNSVNYHQNGNFRNICDKCAKKYLYNENNVNYVNGFRNYNAMRLCTTCKKMFGEVNGNKRNNHFIFA